MNQTVEVAQNIGQNLDGAAAVQQQAGTWNMLITTLLIMVVLYFFMIRPGKKRMAEYQKMLNSIKVGDRVLAAGMYGTVKSVDEKTVHLEIAKGVVVEMNKNAVVNIE